VPIGQEDTISQQVTGQHGVPEDAAAVAINITAIGPTHGSFLTFFPNGAERPLAATVNLPCVAPYCAPSGVRSR
jgi:hypothetical protein